MGRDESRIEPDGALQIGDRGRQIGNPERAEQAPGPTIPVGSPVTWTYVITNRSALTFTSLSVTDDQEGDVACPKMLPQPGRSLTCTGSGTAVAGQDYAVPPATTVVIRSRCFR